MSGRAGIYKGPNGEELYGDGREVEVGSSTMSNAPDIPSDEAMWAVMSPASTIPAPLPLPADLDYLRGEIKIHVANLAKLREERDRAQDALREHHEMAISEDQAYQGSDMYIKTLAALKPVSDRHLMTRSEHERVVARLEAEKQDARRIGLEFALHLATETADWCIEEQEKGYLGAMRVADAIKRELSKPTAPRSTGETESPILDVNHE